MSNERKCQAGCGHPRESHTKQGVPSFAIVPEWCRQCRESGLNNWSHPFETIESLRAEVEVQEQALDEAARLYNVCGDNYRKLETRFADLREKLNAVNAQFVAQTTAMQDDLHDALIAAGLPTHARDASPHEVMVNELIPRIAELTERLTRETWGHCDAHRVTWTDLSRNVANNDIEDDPCVGCGYVGALRTLSMLIDAVRCGHQFPRPGRGMKEVQVG